MELLSGENAAFERKMPKVWLGAVLVVALLLHLLSGAGAAYAAEEGAKPAAPSKADVGKALSDLQSLLVKAEPVSDWAAFGLARSGMPVAERYLPLAGKSAEDGSLRLVTDFARVALAVNANGGDASKLGATNVDLIAKIAGFEKMSAQGPNAPAYALIALDAVGYAPGTSDRWTRDDLIKWLVDNRNTDNGWSLTKGSSDVDITAIVLTALAPYQDRKDVRGVVDAALEWLSAAQLSTGGFGGSAEASESTAQTLIALTALGLDPANDSRFVKNGKSALARLLEFRLADGQFSHSVGGKADGMANFYALLGLAAVDRYWDGVPGLFSGVRIESKSAVTVNGLSGTLANGTVTGNTALEALTNLLKKSGVSYAVERHPQFGPYLTTVDGLASGKFGGYDGWQFVVKRNGAWETIMEGMGTFALQAGDEMHVYYGDSGTQLIHSVKLDPSAPREGQPVAVTVEKESYDWDSGKTVISPAEGATVKIGGQTAVTDKDGKASFASFAAGKLPVSVNGYRSEGTPLYVEWKSDIDVAAYAKNVTVRVEGDAGTLAAGQARGGTALEAVETLLKAKQVKYDVKELSFGKYIAAVNGIEAGKYGGYDGWMFAVVRGGAWIIPAEGVGTFLLENGDEVVVYYGGDATKLAEPLTVSPAAPKPGEEITVTVANRAWNWTENQFDPAQPIAGATVSVGTAQAVTDEKGIAKLKVTAEGLYTLQVTGYAKDGAPNVVRSTAALPVAGVYSDSKAVASWAQEAVRIARAASVFNGPADAKTAFEPKQAVTRAEFVSALVRALGLKGKGSPSFKDISGKAWYAKDIQAAVAAGLVGGVAPDKFAPDATLTREQAAMLLTRALKLKATQATTLADAGKVSAGAAASVQAVLSAGWMTAYEGRFSPKASLSREQAAVIAVRILLANRE